MCRYVIPLAFHTYHLIDGLAQQNGTNQLIIEVEYECRRLSQLLQVEDGKYLLLSLPHRREAR